MIIKWYFEGPTVGSEMKGEIDVDDNASDEEIDAEVREDIFNFISWSWERVERAHD